MAKIMISAKSEKGFWRCGTFFPKEGKHVEQSDFTQAQWDVLKAEPNLIVDPVAPATPPSAAAKPTPKRTGEKG
ncbi:MAG: HI1506-related protein [Planktomarina sp.]